MSEDLSSKPLAHVESSCSPTAQQVYECMLRLAGGKAIGLDGIAAEILKAGGARVHDTQDRPANC